MEVSRNLTHLSHVRRLEAHASALSHVGSLTRRLSHAKGDYGEKRKLIFYKEDGKKTKVGSVTGTWCASWEPYNHTKRGPGAGPPDATA